MKTDDLAVLFEGAPAFVDRLEADHSDDVLTRAEEIALSMPEAEQIELLNSHPRIGAAPATVSSLSYREQGYDQDPGTAELQLRLARLNDEYERRFGFRFVVFVAGRSRSEIADVLERQLGATRDAERDRGLREVIAIARDRSRRIGADVALSPEVANHYDGGVERDRLAAGAGRLELVRTQQILHRWLPLPPRKVIDVGGAAGVHAAWLAADGYDVLLVDPLPLHVEQARQASAKLGGNSFRVKQADARHLPVASASIDIVLMLGPLYHLTERSQRLAALTEARRVLAPGGWLAVAAIGRFGDWMDGIARDLFDEEGFRQIAETSVKTGQHRDATGRWFTTSYFHRPGELEQELRDAGFELDGVIAVEGVGFLLGDLDARLADDARRDRLLEALEFVEREQSIVGASPHLLALTRKPEEGQ